MTYKFSIVALMFSPMVMATDIQPPQLKVGDRWEMHRVDGYDHSKELWHWTYQVDKIDNGMVFYSGKNNHGDYKAKSTIQLNWISKNKLTAGQDIKVLQWPLSENKSYPYEYTTENYTGTAQVKVIEMTKVDVPAGTFDALKIHITGFWENNSSGRIAHGVWTRDIWYSPIVKNIIKSEYKDFNTKGLSFNWTTEELVSYTPAN
ncbi:hypothetical protein [Paludibacterium yongneupense]|uniref:hypothetical protein n=1 Tax=Paludibacterium yongneupense TaxID=400061 RepID=UPI00048BC05A|nr:hypothetical protein [Paludibacterium yongneupense]